MATVKETFHLLSDEELNNLALEGDLGDSSKKNMKYALAKLENFASCTNTDLSTIAKSSLKLDSFLSSFYAAVRKIDGLSYSRMSLLTIRFGLQCHYSIEHGYNICDKRQFPKNNQVFKGVLKKLKKEGKWKVKQGPRMTTSDMQKILASLNCSTPSGLQGKVLIDIMVGFSIYNRDRLRPLKSSDFEVHTDEGGLRYLVLESESTEKARKESFVCEIPGSDRCPVKSFLFYVSKLSGDCQCLWQKPVTTMRAHDPDPPWYSPTPLGKNALVKILRELSKQAGCSKIYTNQSLKSFSMSTLCSLYVGQDSKPSNQAHTVPAQALVCGTTGSTSNTKENNRVLLGPFKAAQASTSRGSSGLTMTTVGNNRLLLGPFEFVSSGVQTSRVILPKTNKQDTCSNDRTISAVSVQPEILPNSSQEHNDRSVVDSIGPCDKDGQGLRREIQEHMSNKVQGMNSNEQDMGESGGPGMKSSRQKTTDGTVNTDVQLQLASSQKSNQGNFIGIVVGSARSSDQQEKGMWQNNQESSETPMFDCVPNNRSTQGMGRNNQETPDRTVKDSVDPNDKHDREKQRNDQEHSGRMFADSVGARDEQNRARQDRGVNTNPTLPHEDEYKCYTCHKEMGWDHSRIFLYTVQNGVKLHHALRKLQCCHDLPPTSNSLLRSFCCTDCAHLIFEYHNALNRVKELRDKWRCQTGYNPPNLQLEHSNRRKNPEPPKQTQNMTTLSQSSPEKSPARKVHIPSSFKPVKLHVVKGTISQKTLATSKTPSGQPGQNPVQLYIKCTETPTDGEAGDLRNASKEAEKMRDAGTVSLEIACRNASDVPSACDPQVTSENPLQLQVNEEDTHESDHMGPSRPISSDDTLELLELSVKQEPDFFSEDSYEADATHSVAESSDLQERWLPHNDS